MESSLGRPETNAVITKWIQLLPGLQYYFAEKAVKTVLLIVFKEGTRKIMIEELSLTNEAFSGI